MAALVLSVSSSVAWGCSDVSAAEAKDSHVVLAQQEGAGTDAVAVRVEYVIDEEAGPAQRPLSVFIDVSGADKTADWRKIGPLIPFGPAGSDNVNQVTLAIPASLKNDIKSGANSFPVALSSDETPGAGGQGEGLSLKSATVIRD
tara:strand:+ start:4626 stop:5060 length:435 start_codon:yes stop_codon:yes gene_type:complete